MGNTRNRLRNIADYLGGRMQKKLDCCLKYGRVDPAVSSGSENQIPKVYLKEFL